MKNRNLELDIFTVMAKINIFIQKIRKLLLLRVFQQNAPTTRGFEIERAEKEKRN